ncbi:hypothetical protein CERSUDRAFT_28758, partial [Gelatoporia subvermispora B]
SSPIRGATRAERTQAARAKRVKHRLRVRDKEERQAEVEKSRRNEDLFESVLRQLKEHGTTFGDLLLYVSDPGNQRGYERYWGLFSIKGRVTSILKHWASSENSQTGRDAVIQWAVEYVRTMIRREGRVATRDGFLQASRMAVNADFALDFSLERMHKRLEDLCPTTLSLLMSFSTTAKQKRSNNLTAISRKQNCITTASLICLGARSQKNSYTRQVLGLYMYACGAQRQVISVLSHVGLCSSYPMIVGRAHDVKDLSSELEVDEDACTATKSKTTGLGLLRRLAEACRRVVHQLAQDEFLGTAYDNINFMLRIAEQILGRKDAQENGTCATAFPLFGATSDAMSTAALMASFRAAPALSRDDVLLSPLESQCLETRLVHTVLRIIIAHGGASFSRFKENVDELIKTSVTSDKIELHKTKIYPLPAMHIDESSITGNAEVVETIMHELGYNMQSPEFTNHVKVIAGDQLSITRLRSIALNRIGHDSFNHSFLWLVTMPGLFHYKMTATHGLMELFYGSSNSARNPGSLAFHNTVLDRKPIVMSSLPPFRVCRDLVFVSLYARVLHCLEIVVSCESLNDYAESIIFEQLKVDAKRIVSQFANLQVVGKLRSARETEQRSNRRNKIQSEQSQPDSALFRPTDGDELFENAVLFMHGALMLREFTDAIKAGDSGRIILVLKFWALGFRGCGRTKYAHEVLHLLHNLTYVWPKDLRDVVVQNWLVNPTGCENAWVEVDLMQEHLNLWTKTIYKAHGSNASWDWLTMISPCIEVLRQLASQMNKTLGAKQGNKHKMPDLHQDIEELKRSLSEHEVYQVVRGRTLDVDKAVVPNVISVGLSHLGSALREFNTVFTNIQARLRLKPLVGTTYPASGNGTDAISPSTEVNPRLSSYQVEGAGSQRADGDEGSDATSDSGSSTDDNEDLFFSLESAEDVALDMD